ncbi:MAG: exo-alpha-sialidase [Chlamydiae bacterium]|nr:exo-alpha-sialidase [Chlamydiota bacterium]
MRQTRFIPAVFLVAAALLLSAAQTPGQECQTWEFDDPAGFTGNHVLIGDGAASLQKSREIGEEWEDVSLPYGADISQVRDLEVLADGCLYASSSRPIAGGPECGVICKSCDGGLTWSCADLEVPGVRRCMRIGRFWQAADGTIYAGGYDYSFTTDNSGVWKSVDDGATWTLVHALPGTGCTSVVEAADGALLASTQGGGTVWRCAEPVGAPGTWTAVFETPSIPWGGAPATYPPYPPPVLPACDYLWDNYGEGCGGNPYTSYPNPYRPDRTQSLFRADDGTLFVSINSGAPSIWSGGVAVRNFAHIYLSSDNGLTWQDSGPWDPPPVTEPYYWGYWDGAAWVQHHHLNGSFAADPVPTMQSFPTWVDHIWQDRGGTIYAASSSGDPYRSWIIDPRPDGIVFAYNPVDKVWEALGNLPGLGVPPGTDTYSQNNVLYCHEIDEDAVTGHLYAATSSQALVVRSEDGGTTWDWAMSPRPLFGKDAAGDFYCIEVACNSCLYLGYRRFGEVYASRSAYHDDGYVQNAAGYVYGGPLAQFVETAADDSHGTVTYWLSADGSTWRWWDGSGWAATTDPAESNTASTVNAHIGSFPSPGTLFFRAFLHPATVHGCPKSPRLASLEVCAGTPTPTVTPTGTPTPTQTPAPCNTPLEIGDITDLHIASTRSSIDGGWFFYFGLADDVYYNPLGYVGDNSNIFTDGAAYTPQPAGVWVGRDSEDIAIQAGDYVTVTYDGGLTKRIYFPAIYGADVTLYIAHDGSTYWDLGLCDLAQGVPTPTPTGTPTETPTRTPTPCNTPLEIGDITALRIAATRAQVSSGWSFYFGLADDVYGKPLGYVYDNSNIFTDKASYAPQPAGVLVGLDQEGIAVQAGDYVTVTYDGGQTKRVYFPAIHGDTVGLYIAHDGSTYWDRGLCDLAQAAPTSTPTPTPEVCSCREVALEVSPETLSPGDSFVVSVCIPVIPPPPVDIYCVILGPGGRFWSLTPNGELVDGIRPAARGYANADCFCNQFRHTACTGLTPGTYSMCLGLMPAGAPPDTRKALDLDWAYVTVR